MNEVFADTFFWLAMLNRLDPAHPRVMEQTASARRRFLTTARVMLEVADAFSGENSRAAFVKFWNVFQSEPYITFLPADHRTFLKGIDLYCRRPDKSWSLTDCTSFVVMTERGIREALTGDRHFEQAGFVALLK